MNYRNNCTYKFGDFRLDAENNLLYRNGNTIKLANKTCEVLTTLIKRKGEVVTKDELLQNVWNEAFVEEGILTVHISNLRKALEDDRNNPRFIETIPKKGYRFIGGVEEIDRTKPVQEKDRTNFDFLVEESEKNKKKSDSEQFPIKSRKDVLENPPILERIERRPVFFSLIFLILAGAALTIFLGYKTFKTDFGEMEITMLTGTDKSRRAAISPDGKYVAHIVVEASRQSLWLKQIATNNNAQLIAPENFVYSGVTFSRDGNYIYLRGRGVFSR